MKFDGLPAVRVRYEILARLPDWEGCSSWGRSAGCNLELSLTTYLQNRPITVNVCAASLPQIV